MKSALAVAALAAAVVTGSVASSQAAIVASGAADPVFGNFTGGNATAAANTKYYSFVIPFLGSYTVSASVTTAPSSGVTFSAFNFYNAAGTQLGPSGTVLAGSGNKTFNIGNYTFPMTAQTTYYVGVTSQGRGGYTGNIAVSAVPLPGSVALFGTAIAALGVAGAVKRKSRKSVAVTA